MKNIILTGDRPTGKLHIGHFVGSLRERLRLQNEGNFDKMIILIADVQALTDNAGVPLKVRDSVMELMLDYLSIGLDPDKVIFCIQSEIGALTDLTQYYSNLVTMSRLLRNPTVKNEIKLRGFDEEGENQTGLPVGFANYPISQAADITAFKANIVPVGEDQEPMLEQTREIVRSFNRVYNTNTLVECKALLPDKESCLRLPGTDGAKMSKSLGNCIYLSDSPSEIKKKVNSIKTAPRALEEPGVTKDNVAFIYLDAFASDDHFAKYYPEFKNLAELKAAYEKGGIGDGKIKGFLANVLIDFLSPIREKRVALSKNIPYLYEILKRGTMEANKLADETLNEVKNAMNINYFNDNTYLQEQISKFENYE